MRKLSSSKERVLEIIREYTRRGQSPTMNEIAQVLRVSKQAVHKSIGSLRNLGLIEGPNYKHRSFKPNGAKLQPVIEDYKTPPSITESLLDNEEFLGQVWEPACGDGAMSDVLISRFGNKRVRATDIAGGVDFLISKSRADNIITNPPFSKTEAFVEHALKLANHKVALLLRLEFLEKARCLNLRKLRLKTVHAFYHRQTLKPTTGPLRNHASVTISLAWFVWEKGFAGANAINWLE